MKFGPDLLIRSFGGLMKKKYYAVYSGKEGNKLYTSWEEAQKNIMGISNVKYKAFLSEEEALEFIESKGDYGLFKKDIEKIPVVRQVKEVDAVDEGGIGKGQIKAGEGLLTAYVDGSFKEGKSCYGFGVILISGGEVIHTIKGSGDEAELISMRNVAGEVKGAMAAMDYGLKMGFKEMNIHYDYTGIEHWARGTWKRNNPLTRAYHLYVNSIKDKIKINFIKVKGHSGDYFNEKVDSLAKEAVEDY